MQVFSAPTAVIVLLNLKMLCINTESFTTTYRYKKIERFNKTLTGVESEQTNILYFLFLYFFSQLKTHKTVVYMCIAYQSYEKARLMRMTKQFNLLLSNPETD